MNKKGFTLTELLVVMVILSIITAISIPLIRNIRQSNVQKEYQNYTNSIKYGAKLYVDSYGEDLFGHNESGCAIISYKDLKDKNLVKDFNKDNITCETEDTFVRVVKMGDKYGYAASIGCGKINSKGNVDISYRYPKNGVGNIDTCGVGSTAIMSFRTNITDPTALKYKTRSMKVIVSSNTGIDSNPIIQYAFSDTNVGSSVSSWSTLTIHPNPSGAQTEKILAGEIIEVFSQQIETPKDLTGKYYLILRIDRLQDLHHNNWSQEGTDPYVYLGPFTLDNTKPEFNDSTVISSTDGYNALKPKLALKVTDVLSASNETEAKEHLKMCTSFETDTCSKNRTAFVGYEAYDPNKVLDKIKDALDGSMHKVFVTVVDPAGNYQTKEFSYELASVITYNGNGSTGGSTAKTYCNNNTDCPLRTNGFERNGYSYIGWFNQASGGTQYGATVRLTGNITVYAHWNGITYTITYYLNGGSATNNTTYSTDTPTFTLNNPTKTGYTFDGWTGSNGTAKQKTVKIEIGSTGDKTFTANYSINSYTITYNGNGSTGGSTDSTTCNYMEDCSLRANGFSKSGYVFEGWYTDASGGSKYGASTQLSSNINVYAHWIPATPYTVVFNYNKASWNRNTTRTCTPGSNGKCSVTAPAIRNISGSNKSGQRYSNYFNILGWNTNASATTATYEANASIEVSGDTTFYAIVTLAKTSFWSNADALISRVDPGTNNLGYGEIIGGNGIYGDNTGHYLRVDNFAYVDDNRNPIWLRVASYDSFYSCQTGPGINCPASGCSCTHWSSAYYLIYP